MFEEGERDDFRDENADPTAELAAMQSVSEAIKQLEAPVQRRVLLWALEVFSGERQLASTARGNASVKQLQNPEGAPAIESSETGDFEDIVDLYAAADAKSDTDKALVTSYWLQEYRGLSDVDTQTVNSELKHLGHGVTNITRAFDKLTKTRPQLVIQTRKSGTSRQARKRFKVTVEGKKAVLRMISRDSE